MGWIRGIGFHYLGHMLPRESCEPLAFREEAIDSTMRVGGMWPDAWHVHTKAGAHYVIYAPQTTPSAFDCGSEGESVELPRLTAEPILRALAAPGTALPAGVVSITDAPRKDATKARKRRVAR